MTTPRRSSCSSRKAWRAIATVAPAAAVQLRDEYGLSLLAIDDGPDAFDVEVDRTEQRQAIRCHFSQHDDDPAVFKRLRVQGHLERVGLHRAGARRPWETV